VEKGAAQLWCVGDGESCGRGAGRGRAPISSRAGWWQPRDSRDASFPPSPSMDQS